MNLSRQEMSVESASIRSNSLQSQASRAEQQASTAEQRSDLEGARYLIMSPASTQRRAFLS